MTNGHGIETPANKIATAQATLSLAIRLSAEVESGRITTAIYNRSVNVQTGGAGFLPFPEGTETHLKHGIFNIVLNALSISALTVDETLDEVFGKSNAGIDQNLVSIKVMVNQLRNAFAHNPWRPKWVIHQKYKTRYPMTIDVGSHFTFGATNLDGDGVMPEHVGGWEFWTKLLQHCERLVAGRP